MNTNSIFEKIKQKTYRIRHLQEYSQSLSFMKRRYELVHKIVPFTWLDDRYYLEYIFYKKMKYHLNLRDPKTFNEKINWMKLYDRNPLYQQLADKFLVRNYVKNRIGPQYLVPLVACYDRPDQIEWDALPSKFVIKPNHGAGWIVINDGSGLFDHENAIIQINTWLGTNFYKIYREWQYKNIERKILIEDLLATNSPFGLLDYKFFCFNGSPQYVQLNIDRFTDFSLLFLDVEWNLLQVSLEHYPRSNKVIPKPENLPELIDVARALAQGLKFCRVDLYSLDNKIFFGEMTITPNAGMKNFYPPEFDLKLGSLIDLNSKALKK